MECPQIYNLKKQIYPKVSKKYNKTINSIKTNILRSTDMMYYACDEDALSDFLGYDIVEKPRIKDIINKVIENI